MQSSIQKIAGNQVEITPETVMAVISEITDREFEGCLFDDNAIRRHAGAGGRAIAAAVLARQAVRRGLPWRLLTALCLEFSGRGGARAWLSAAHDLEELTGAIRDGKIDVDGDQVRDMVLERIKALRSAHSRREVAVLAIVAEATVWFTYDHDVPLTSSGRTNFDAAAEMCGRGVTFALLEHSGTGEADRFLDALRALKAAGVSSGTKRDVATRPVKAQGAGRPAR